MVDAIAEKEEPEYSSSQWKAMASAEQKMLSGRAAAGPLNCPLYSPRPAEKTHRGSNQAAEHKVH